MRHTRHGENVVSVFFKEAVVVSPTVAQARTREINRKAGCDDEC